MTLFTRLSFRQLLLGVFLLIAVLLSAASIHALFTLDQLTYDSRAAAHHAVRITENAQRLDERSVAMERSARQFLVLGDAAFRQRYADAWREAGAALDIVASGLPAGAQADADAWRSHSAAAWAVLMDVHARRGARQQALNEALTALPALNARLGEQARHDVELRNSQLLRYLEQRRTVLTAQVLASIALAALLAAGVGIWLARPLARIEAAIDQLGANRFDAAIDVHGPDDLRRVGRQLDWLRRRLADLEADKARFLRHISHELKTPLAALREGVSLLEDGLVGELSTGQREITGILRQNTAALQNQIEDLLRYNAATFDAQHLERRPLDPLALVRETIEAQRLQWQAAHVTVTLDGAAREATLDHDKIGAAVANLLSNALRFSPPGAAIAFTVGEHQGALRIDCRDQGPGVAGGDAARIFEPFYQGQRQPPGARHGNGIGLSIVREYVAAHGGAIELLPSDQGAHFCITLPYDH